MKIFIGYVSMSGNTEDIANILKDVLSSSSCEVEMGCLDSIDVETLTMYDFILIGTYTWGDGDLPYEVEDFYDELDHLDLEDVYAACFGSGDYAYPKFCEAVDTLANKLAEEGCHVFNQRLKIELGPELDEQVKECRDFAQSAYEWVLAEKEVANV